MPEIIVITGARSDAGKTSLARWIVGNLPGQVAAIKTSVSDQYDRTDVTSNPRTTRRGKDTHRLQEAGAEPAVLLRSPPDELAKALDEAQAEAGSCDYLVIEGNRVLQYTSPALVLFVDAAGAEKPSAGEARRACHITVNQKQLRRITDEGDNLAFSVAVESMSCSRAHLVALAFDAPPRAVGDKFTSEGIKLRSCQLGCF